MTELRARLGMVLASILLVLLLLGVGGGIYWYRLYTAIANYSICIDSPAEEIAPGATIAREGVPYWLWLVLPRLFPEYLPGPGSHTALGIDWEPGQELPIGFSKQIIGFPQQATTFISCNDHLASTAETDALHPSERFDLKGYIVFFQTAARDPRFDADYIMNASNGIAYVYDLSWLDRFIYRSITIPAARRMFLKA